MRARAAWAALISIVAVDAVIAVAKPSPLHFSESVVTRSLLSFASVATIRLPRYSERKARLQRLSLRASQRELSSTPTKLRHGMGYMSGLKSSGSITRKPVRSTGPAPIGPKGTSAACDALKSAFTTIVQVRTSFAPRKRARGGKTTGASRMSIK